MRSDETDPTGSVPGWLGRLCLCCAALLALPDAASAQETVLAIEFSFANPGARSMGFGGAFAALADDATAAFANPAGLVQLARSEVSAEGRAWDYSTPFAEGGRIVGEPSGIGIDTTAGIRTGRSSEELAGVSFLSFIYPRRNWAVALFRHLPANFEFYGETSGFLRGFPGDPPGTERFNDQRSDVDLRIVSHGVAAAYRVNDVLSLGLGVSHMAGELTSEAELFKAVTLYDPPMFRPEDLEIRTVLFFDSTDWTWTGGFLWRVTDRWRLGGFYREAPWFDLKANVWSGPRGPAPDGTLLASVFSRVSLPDVWGLGWAYQSPRGRFTLALEWDRVEYATIIESIDESTWGEVTSAMDDGDEWHLGGELVFPGLTPLLALRAGVWLDPDHSLRAAEGTSVLVQALRPPRDDELHYAAGVGLAFESVQLDLAIDLSDRRDTASLSAIYSF